MTKKEIIEECKQRLGFDTKYEMYSLCKYEIDFYNAIIEVLEQQPSEDCVSRQAVLEMVNAECVDLQDGSELWRSCVNDTVESIYYGVKDLPTVTPTHGTCRDCEHYRRIELNSCDEVIATCKKHTDRNYQYVSPNFYCADFEKRGNENDI